MTETKIDLPGRDYQERRRGLSTRPDPGCSAAADGHRGGRRVRGGKRRRQPGPGELGQPLPGRRLRSNLLRGGYRPRQWDTRAGTIGLNITKLRKGSYFPAFLEPRRTAEKALMAVIQEAYSRQPARPVPGCRRAHGRGRARSSGLHDL